MRSTVSPLPETITIGTSCLARISRARESPSSCPRAKSSVTRLTIPSFSAARVAAASAASATAYPSRSKHVLSRRRISGSSSTTRIFVVTSALRGAWRGECIDYKLLQFFTVKANLGESYRLLWSRLMPPFASQGERICWVQQLFMMLFRTTLIRGYRETRA
ncbi:hypothetical protein HYPGJ_30521 [Hyphomicrobium sp. GJ21]|nr:hypothetical protein HYPGJ_30521 [Hyphomicrobium sp. GJ21]